VRLEVRKTSYAIPIVEFRPRRCAALCGSVFEPQPIEERSFTPMMFGYIISDVSFHEQQKRTENYVASSLQRECTVLKYKLLGLANPDVAAHIFSRTFET